MLKLPWAGASVVCAVALIAACGDDGLDDSTDDGAGAAGASSGETSSTASSTGAATVGSGSTSGAGGGAISFANDVWPILSMPRNPPLSGSSDSCSGANGCHLTGAGGLALPDVTTAYTNLIDTPSSSDLCAGMVQVVASQPDDSCFVVFYEQRLRDSLGWVDQEETDFIRAWVEQGALP
jgi:hypothetical protein